MIVDRSKGELKVENAKLKREREREQLTELLKAIVLELARA